MKILTGNTGTNHITAADDGALNAAIVGSGCYVFEIGSKFAATIVSSTSVRIADGEGVLQGRHFRTESGASDSVSLAENADGYNRNDLIGVQFSTVAGKESVALAVIQGTATTGEAADPSYEAGDLLGGGSAAFMPLYRAKLRGASLDGVDALYTLVGPISAHAAEQSAHVADQNNPHKVTLAQLGARSASYSTDEVATGGTFIDGKPLYRKTIVYTNSNTGLLSYDISSLQAEYICVVDNVINFAYGGSGNYWATGAWYNSQTSSVDYDYHRVYIKGNTLNFSTGTKIDRITEYVTLEYTKAE